MRYYPVLEVNDPMARELWPRHAFRHVTDGFRIMEQTVDLDRIRSLRTPEDAKRIYAGHAERLNAEYANGNELFRANYIERRV